jgi:ABC-type multidrug transport system fused ATPase/permease subunit
VTPKILILDDCLSAVDTNTENIILNNLRRIMADRTSVVISHRVSSAKLADYIIMLDKGEIVEQEPTKTCWLATVPTANCMRNSCRQKKPRG